MSLRWAVVVVMLAALPVAQGCAPLPSPPPAMPRRGQLDEAMVRDTRECQAAAERLSHYSNTGVVGFWVGAVAGYTMVVVIVAGSVASYILGQPSSTGSGSWTDVTGPIGAFVGSEPRLEDYLEKYEQCMSARGNEVSRPAGCR
jgi:hypothetical protein